MSVLRLDNNSFSGTADLSQLPLGINILNLRVNKLSGEVFISDALFDIVKVDNTKLSKRHMK